VGFVLGVVPQASSLTAVEHAPSRAADASSARRPGASPESCTACCSRWRLLAAGQHSPRRQGCWTPFMSPSSGGVFSCVKSGDVGLVAFTPKRRRARPRPGAPFRSPRPMSVPAALPLSADRVQRGDQRSRTVVTVTGASWSCHAHAVSGPLSAVPHHPRSCRVGDPARVRALSVARRVCACPLVPPIVIVPLGFVPQIGVPGRCPPLVSRSSDPRPGISGISRQLPATFDRQLVSAACALSSV